MLILLVPATAGCNVRDWWNMEGTVHFGVKAVSRDESPVPGYRSAMGDFRELSVAVVGVSVKQVGEINPRHFSFQDEPLVVDLVDIERRGVGVPLAREKLTIRAIEQVTITMVGFRAVTAAGDELEFCHPGQQGVTKPCVSMPSNGGYRHNERNFSSERGGESEFLMAFEVLYTPEGREYVLFRDPAQATIRKL